MRHELYERAGTFFVPREMLGELSDAFTELMTRVIVVRTDYHVMRDGIEYTALSTMFARVPMGAIAPRYEMVVKDGHFAGFVPC